MSTALLAQSHQSSDSANGLSWIKYATRTATSTFLTSGQADGRLYLYPYNTVTPSAENTRASVSPATDDIEALQRTVNGFPLIFRVDTFSAKGNLFGNVSSSSVTLSIISSPTILFSSATKTTQLYYQEFNSHEYETGIVDLKSYGWFMVGQFNSSYTQIALTASPKKSSGGAWGTPLTNLSITVTVAYLSQGEIDVD